MAPTVAIQAALNSKNAAQFAQYVPVILEYFKSQKPAEMTELEKESAEQFFEKFQNILANTSDGVAQYAIGFQKLSHQQKIELMDKLDISKLDSEGTAKVLEAEIKEGNKTSRWNTIVTGGVAVLGLLAMFDTVDKVTQKNYNLKRPRSLSEKVFGDKK